MKNNRIIENLAPIVLFTYNRPKHIKLTIEALKKNKYAEDSSIFIYSDNAKTPKEQEKVKEVRKIINNVSGFRSVHVVEREDNYGLGKNIIEAVTEIVEKYGKVIVLEDDIITSPFFLDYMNKALMLYEKEEKVMSISGYTPPIDVSNIKESTFFMSWPDCWGWATWKRAWDKFERNPQKLINDTGKKLINKININGNAPFMWQQVIDNYRDKKYTWAIFFHVTICREEGLTLYSKYSLTSNEGMDGSGTDSGVKDSYNVSIIQENEITYFPPKICANKKADYALEKFYRTIKLQQNLLFRISNVIKKEGIEGIKKRIIKRKKKHD